MNKSKTIKVDQPNNTTGKVVLGGDEKLTMDKKDMANNEKCQILVIAKAQLAVHSNYN